MIDEATMEFSQSVLSAYLSDSPAAARWEENDVNGTTDSDETHENQETETENEDAQSNTGIEEENKVHGNETTLNTHPTRNYL